MADSKKPDHEPPHPLDGLHVVYDNKMPDFGPTFEDFVIEKGWDAQTQAGVMRSFIVKRGLSDDLLEYAKTVR